MGHPSHIGRAAPRTSSRGSRPLRRRPRHFHQRRQALVFPVRRHGPDRLRPSELAIEGAIDELRLIYLTETPEPRCAAREADAYVVAATLAGASPQRGNDSGATQVAGDVVVHHEGGWEARAVEAAALQHGKAADGQRLHVEAREHLPRAFPAIRTD
jgi:hypothetical protein